MSRKHVYIVGAGFSHYAGLPLQANFTKALLEPREDEAYPLRPLINHLGEFVGKAFDHNRSAGATFWPNLEDVFTNIDMAANTGHHLGPDYAPSKLRTTRRILLARMMCMLQERLNHAATSKEPDLLQLDSLFKRLELDESAFISMNWDTVIEQKLFELRKLSGIDYQCDAIPSYFPKRSSVVAKRSLPGKPRKVPVVKMHGSVNWLYCDSCRQLYWFRPEAALKVAMQLITKSEGVDLGLADTQMCARWCCSTCIEVPLTTRIATFSFLKALDFPMFERSWLSAENLLRQAKKWIFIGYSLPAADFEFKHLLKRVQLSRADKPDFVVITGGPAEAAKNTYRNYQGFFGRGIRRDAKGIEAKTFFSDGLTREAIDAIHS